MAEIAWTEKAHRWLRDIHDYVAVDSPTAAQRVVSGIYERAQVLRRFPEIGYRYREEEDEGIRILFYGHYRIAYHIKSASRIDVLGVFHGALDIDRYLP